MGTDSSSVFLMENLTIQCYSWDHWFMVLTLGLPLLLMYVKTPPKHFQNTPNPLSVSFSLLKPVSNSIKQ